MSEYTEECCFNVPRDSCKGDGCPCGCHDRERRQKRMTIAEWQSIKIEDFERLEARAEAAEAEVAELLQLLLNTSHHWIEDVGTCWCEFDWEHPTSDCERIRELTGAHSARAPREAADAHG